MSLKRAGSPMDDLVPGDPVKGRSPQESGTDSVVIPVVQEYLEVSKELQTTGLVQVRKYIHKKEALVSELLTAETVEVERVPRNEIVETAPPVRTEGGTTIIPVLEEVLVVTKQLRLIEEVRITRRVSSSVHEELVTLRAEEVEIERQTFPNVQSSDSTQSK